MRTIISLHVLLLACGSLAARAEPHLGFDVENGAKGVQVTKVYDHTPAAKEGVRIGDHVMAVAGLPVTTVEEIQKALRPRKVGGNIRVKVSRLTGPQDIKVQLLDGDALRAAEAERRATQRARAEKEAREAIEKATNIAKYISEKGPLIYVGKVEDNVIGTPEILLMLHNISPEDVDAVEFEVRMFDKFGRPALGFAGDSNTKRFLHQKAIAPSAEVLVRANVLFHDTVGKAEIVATKFVMGDGRIVEPPQPKVVIVSK